MSGMKKAVAEYVNVKNEQLRADGRWRELVFTVEDDDGHADAIREALDDYLERLNSVRMLAQAYASAAIAALGEANE